MNQAQAEEKSSVLSVLWLFIIMVEMLALCQCCGDQTRLSIIRSLSVVSIHTLNVWCRISVAGKPLCYLILQRGMHEQETTDENSAELITNNLIRLYPKNKNNKHFEDLTFDLSCTKQKKYYHNKQFVRLLYIKKPMSTTNMTNIIHSHIHFHVHIKI
ncbi:hypothetical protein T11_5678 [Trichinella zimbabwensis]|uniref:Uncharacterized protein n=1 Tax=Trichinella zimbabwensis TaxID=268475 RepID=A0A0V1I2T8_9BILA|nr:hypothetical protein T11_5678 [Trichinella zimbabwensis]